MIRLRFSCGCTLENNVKDPLDEREAIDAATAARLLARDRAIQEFRKYGDQDTDAHVNLRRTVCPLHPSHLMTRIEDGTNG